MSRAISKQLFVKSVCCLFIIELGLFSINGSPISAADKATVATVADAVKALDFMKFPVMEGAVEPVDRTVARLSYLVKGNSATAFEFQRKSLLKLQWSEVPGSMVTDEYASGMFTSQGFLVSVSVIPSYQADKPNTVNVSLSLHGNVDLKALPLPPGMKEVYVGPQVAMYSTSASVQDTTKTCRDLLLKAGWQPYGEAENTMWLKQNAVRLTASISASPAQAGQTMISFSSEQLSADIPAPSETVELQYADSTKQLLFETKQSEEQVLAFYQKILGESGWTATTENPLKPDFRKQLIYRNKSKDMFTLEWYPVEDRNVLHVTLKFQTAGEVDAIDKAVAEQIAAKKKQMDSEKNTPHPKVKLALPTGAELKERNSQEIDFSIASGKAKAAVDQIRKTLRDAGWKEEVIVAEAVAGEISLKKGNQEISLSYVDPGFIPGEVTITGQNVDLELSKSK